MDSNLNRADRSPTDYFLFALAFLGFGTAAAGIVLTSPFMALSGLGLLLLALVCFTLANRD